MTRPKASRWLVATKNWLVCGKLIVSTHFNAIWPQQKICSSATKNWLVCGSLEKWSTVTMYIYMYRIWRNRCTYIHVFTWLVKVWIFRVCPLTIQLFPVSFQTCQTTIHPLLTDSAIRHSETIFDYELVHKVWFFKSDFDIFSQFIT